jgi:hypothetical protein
MAPQPCSSRLGMGQTVVNVPRLLQHDRLLALAGSAYSDKCALSACALSALTSRPECHVCNPVCI